MLHDLNRSDTEESALRLRHLSGACHHLDISVAAKLSVAHHGIVVHSLAARLLQLWNACEGSHQLSLWCRRSCREHLSQISWDLPWERLPRRQAAISPHLCEMHVQGCLHRLDQFTDVRLQRRMDSHSPWHVQWWRAFPRLVPLIKHLHLDF